MASCLFIRQAGSTLGQQKIVFSEFRGDVNKPWKMKKRNAGKELRRDCTDSSGRVGLCAPSLPSRVGTSLLRAKQGAAPAMGLIPLVCKGGVEWRRCTIYNSMEHSKAAAAGKGDSSRGKARQWSCSGRNKSV